MINEYVEIINDENFYCDMIGTVVRDEPMAVLVEIEFVGETQRVWFFKDEVREI